MSRRAALAVALAMGGCSLVTDSFVTNDFSGDPFPIAVQRDSGALVVGLRTDDGSPDRTAILDVLSPITIVDPGPDAAPSVRSASLTLLGERTDTGALDLPRAELPDKRIISLHPCEDAACVVGGNGQIVPYDAIVGADALAGDALRLKLDQSQVFVLADTGGDDRDRTFACDAVFPAPYRGGGTLVIAGAEIPFTGRRVTLQACLDHDPTTLVPQQQRGADALFVLSTGLGMSILGESAYERYRLLDPENRPLVTALPVDTLYLASGPIQGRRATIDKLALVAASSSASRAPCRQVYAHDLLLRRNCTAQDDCPCNEGDRFCPIPANLQLEPAAGVPMLIVPDADPTLQALRTELRPDQAEVDGILGTDAIASAELDVDYPHNRVLMRCRTKECLAHPALAEIIDRELVTACTTVED